MSLLCILIPEMGRKNKFQQVGGKKMLLPLFEVQGRGVSGPLTWVRDTV